MCIEALYTLIYKHQIKAYIIYIQTQIHLYKAKTYRSIASLRSRMTQGAAFRNPHNLPVKDCVVCGRPFTWRKKPGALRRAREKRTA